MPLGDVTDDVMMFMAYELGILNTSDVRSLASVCKWMHHTLLGDRFGRNQHRALAGPLFCILKRWWGSAHLAITRGIGQLCIKCLIRAVSAGKLGLTIRILEASDFNINEPSGDPANFAWPFQFAVRNNDIEIMQALIDSGRLDQQSYRRGVLDALQMTRTDLVEMIFDQPEFTLDVLCNLAFQTSVKENRKQIASFILNHPRLTVTQDEINTSCFDAIRFGYIDMVALLLPLTSDLYIETYRNRGIDLAVRINDAPMLRLLLDDSRFAPEEIDPDYVAFMEGNPFLGAACRVLRLDPRVPKPR